MTYLDNTADSVRMKGIEQSALLAEKFGQDWTVKEYIPAIIEAYSSGTKGYNYRIACLKSLAAVMSHVDTDQTTKLIIPMFL